MAARRAQQAKAQLRLASSLHLAASSGSLAAGSSANSGRLKSTSMTNLVATNCKRPTPASGPSSPAPPSNQNGKTQLQRPASRSALDQIHRGMNAKFTHVQSKVLLHNIRPAPADRERATPSAPATLRRAANSSPAAKGPQQSDRSQLLNKIKGLQEEAERARAARDQLEDELARERADKAEQAQQLKLELQAKASESERQNEDYHQKLLEAYELADQNRRAADSVLSESRQREEQLRKRIDELELQLGELKEFVAMKEELVGQMGQMREQMRDERERYEEKTRSLNQMFEKEKISRTNHNSSLADQNSNYFRRAKPALQSSESIDRLDQANGGPTLVEGSELPAQRRQRRQMGQSAQDLYGSKLSTRMQDGARLAWKRSRKFASSVVTSGLGGLAACRKHGQMSPKCSPSKSSPSTDQPQPQRDCSLAPSPSPRPPSSPSSAGRALDALESAIESDEQQQHTSVVEVGATVGEYLAQHAQVSSTLVAHKVAPAQAGGQQDSSLGPEPHDDRQPRESLIRVDENNKLTIVTKFNDLSAAGTSSSCSERSRCESSSSGRGTASDSGSGPGSQNGDHAEPAQPAAGRLPAAAAGNRLLETTSASLRQHKRRSSAALIKGAGSVFSGSQASLNKTFKSFFGTKNLSVQATSRQLAKSPATARPDPARAKQDEELASCQARDQQPDEVAREQPPQKSTGETTSTHGELLGIKGPAPEEQKRASEPATSATARIMNELARFEAKGPATVAPGERVGFLAQSLDERQRKDQLGCGASSPVALAVEN